MTDRRPAAEHPEDLPWHDAPADRIAPASSEPAPAEVVEDGDEAVDLDTPRVPDPLRKYRPDTLDERLAEEELEDPHPAAARITRPLLAPGEPGDEVLESERDPGGDDDVDDLPAEEAAMHVSDWSRRH